MLTTPRSIGRPCDLTAARGAARRDLVVVVACRVRGILTTRCTGDGREDESGADTLGGTTGAMAGGGGEGTRAALPMPEGSLREPLGPRAFAGPGGMPLTPASCARDIEGRARAHSSAAVTTAVLPLRHDRERHKTSCARVIGW
jgi:hypothetical protein